MTLTHERATDPRRVARQEREPTLEEVLVHAGQRQLGRRAWPAESDGDEDRQAGEEDGAAVEDHNTRHSVKRLFAALALGQLLGYGADFELLQFAYDLNLWSSIGSKKNLQLQLALPAQGSGI